MEPSQLLLSFFGVLGTLVKMGKTYESVLLISPGRVHVERRRSFGGCQRGSKCPHYSKRGSSGLGMVVAATCGREWQWLRRCAQIGATGFSPFSGSYRTAF